MEIKLSNRSLWETPVSSAGRRGLTVFIYLWMGTSLLSVPCLTHAEMGSSTDNGNIYGKVRIIRKLISQRMRFRLYQNGIPQPPPTLKLKVERQDEWRNIVIYLESSESMPARHDNDGDNPIITQLGETFFPHILPVVKGSTVEFLNEDPIFHNVFSLSRTKSFDLGRYPQDLSRAVTFEKTGIVPVFCHLHSDMSAIILVLDNPYFAVPDNKGAFQIKDIPAGEYTVVAWHERSERVELQVEVRSGETVELNITVPITDEENTEP